MTLGLSSSILACATCTYGIVETVLPAVRSWSFIFPIWLLALSALQSLAGRDLRFVPRLRHGLFLVPAAILLSFVISLGPLLTVPFAIPVLVGTLSALRSEVPFTRPVTTVAVLLLLTFTAQAHLAAFARSPVERVLRRQNTPVWMIEMRDLQRDEPSSIFDYRELLHASLSTDVNPKIVDRTLERIAVAGDPCTEVSFLIGHLRELEGRGLPGVTGVRSALRELAEIDPPGFASAESLKDAWLGSAKSGQCRVKDEER